MNNTVELAHLLTDTLYSIFNAVNIVKSVEYIGTRKTNNIETTTRSRRNTDHDINLDDTGIADVLIILYDMQDLEVNGSKIPIDDLLQMGLSSASEIIKNQSTINIEPTKPIRPHPVRSGVILGAVLTTVGGIIWLGSCFIIVRHSPKHKTMFWRLKRCLLLGFGISNFWMESQLFVLYAGGEGLLYAPLHFITIALSLLPIIAVLIYTLKCYVTIRYLRMWSTDSYYKARFRATISTVITNFLFTEFS